MSVEARGGDLSLWLWGSAEGATRCVRQQAACIYCTFWVKRSLTKSPQVREQSPEPRLAQFRPLPPDKVVFLCNFAVFGTWWHCINRNSEDLFSFSADLVVEPTRLPRQGMDPGLERVPLLLRALSTRPKASLCLFQLCWYIFHQLFLSKFPVKKSPAS